MHDDCSGLTDYLSSNDPLTVSQWVWGLSRWGKHLLVQAACIAASQTLPVLKTMKNCQHLVLFGQAFFSARSWLLSPSAETLQAAQEFYNAADAELLRVYSGDGPDNGEDAAYYAAIACTFAAEAAAWLPSDVKECCDAVETEAQRQAGPTLQVVNCVHYTRKSLSCIDEAVRQTLVRKLREMKQLPSGRVK